MRWNEYYSTILANTTLMIDGSSSSFAEKEQNGSRVRRPPVVVAYSATLELIEIHQDQYTVSVSAGSFKHIVRTCSVAPSPLALRMHITSLRLADCRLHLQFTAWRLAARKMALQNG